MKRKLALAAATAVLGGALAAALPADATDSRHWGARDCVQGSVFVRSTGPGFVTHQIVRSSTEAVVKTYNNGSQGLTRTTYSGYKSTRSSRADTSATFSAATSNCAD